MSTLQYEIHNSSINKFQIVINKCNKIEQLDQPLYGRIKICTNKYNVYAMFYQE